MPWDGVKALIDRAKTGDADAWRDLFALAHGHLLRLAQKRIGRGWPHRSASDLVSDTWLRAWQHLPDFRGGDDDTQTGALFRAWLTRIVHGVHANGVRHDRAACRTPPSGVVSLDGAGGSADSGRDVPGDDPSPSARLRGDEQRARVAATLATLPVDERAVVELHVVQDWPLGRVADHLGLTYDQVRYRLHAALERLGHDLGD